MKVQEPATAVLICQGDNSYNHLGERWGSRCWCCSRGGFYPYLISWISMIDRLILTSCPVLQEDLLDRLLDYLICI